jgi:hypothetical protein
MNYEQFTMNHKPQSPIRQFSNPLILFAFVSANLGNIYLSNQFNLGNLWLKINQSKCINYAKQSQFSKKSNVYNRSFNNQLQRKFDNGHLVKTNPIKPNLVRHSLGEGGLFAGQQDCYGGSAGGSACYTQLPAV